MDPDTAPGAPDHAAAREPPATSTRPATSPVAKPPAMLVIAPGRADERSTPVHDWLAVGRECAGINDEHRLLVDDASVSRVHLEVRLDLDLDQAWLTDHSTNGTRLNGQRVERTVPVRINPGDKIRLGDTELHFRSDRFGADTPHGQAIHGQGSGQARGAGMGKTLRRVQVGEMAMVVGDIAEFSTIAESTDQRVLLENIDRLYAALRKVLSRHHGMLTNYVGDAFFATWETADSKTAVHDAVAFALDAAETVPRLAPGLDLRDPQGAPLRMGWGVTLGPAAVSLLTGMLVTVLGDATNVAFRLSGIAGRDGRPDVLVTDAVHRAVASSFAFTSPTAVMVKGRRRPVEVLGAGRL
jgi:class 3 adenylate cyclase